MSRLDYTEEEIINLAVLTALDVEKDAISETALRFDLTFAEFKKIIFKNCYFCKGPGLTPLTTRHKRTRLDRLDLYKGFTLDNTISSCTHCYNARRKVPYELVWHGIQVFRKLRKIDAKFKARKIKNKSNKAKEEKRP